MAVSKRDDSIESPPAAIDVSPGGTILGFSPRMALASGPHHAMRSEVNTRWPEYEALGLADPEPRRGIASRFIVSMYRLLGFAILTVIVVVLVTYIVTTAFYYLDRSWITPVAISPSDDKVVQLRSELAAQENVRSELAANLDQTERAIAAEQTFQLEFAKAIKQDLAGRRVALARVEQLARDATTTRKDIRTTNDEFAASSQQQMTDEYAAHLIDRQQMLQGKYTLAQISNSDLSLAERQADFEQRAAELATETRSLDALLADKSGKIPLTYDVLKIKRDYEASKLELAKDVEERTRLRASLDREDQILRGIEQSAYLRVIDDHATVALVPYANLGHVAKGTTLYRCRLSMVVCHEVGTVGEVLPGEVQVKSPRSDAAARGQMIELRLDDPSAAEQEVLFAGSKPFGF